MPSAVASTAIRFSASSGESHDTVGNTGTRLPSQIDPSDPEAGPPCKRSLLAAAILLTAPRVPMLFAGQEICPSAASPTCPPLDWTRETGHARILDFYRDLIALRRNRAGTTLASPI